MTTDEQTSPCNNAKFDMDSLPPELALKVISYIGIADRRMLRSFSSMDDLMSQSHFNFTSHGVSAIDIRQIDYNEFPISYIEELLEGIVFERLYMDLGREEYSKNVFSFIKKHETKEFVLKMDGLIIEKEELLSLAPMKRLVYGGTSYASPTIDDGELLAVANRRHTFLDAAVADLRSPQTIFDVFKSVADYDKSQCLIFEVSFSALNQFMEHIGYRKASYDYAFNDRFINQRPRGQRVTIEHDEFLDGHWTGEFELTYRGGSLFTRKNNANWIIAVHNSLVDRNEELNDLLKSLKEREGESEDEYDEYDGPADGWMGEYYERSAGVIDPEYDW
ncbi:hypothetical protein PFISCL1PPCAC_16476 [Pristionchus fissidentatus]|uniref:F-box domain-containing protein n=1 Tax=Pristionchus fissidentatus TaxID=1538716 RepID=A0AAV5W5P4_9BILA|nr:hypothetical protein PFISCL1PPCAC_16476 [Pristionchus fissidentatus]